MAEETSSLAVTNPPEAPDAGGSVQKAGWRWYHYGITAIIGMVAFYALYLSSAAFDGVGRVYDGLSPHVGVRVAILPTPSSGEATLRLELYNDGAGVAAVRSLEIVQGGRPLSGAMDLRDALQSTGRGALTTTSMMETAAGTRVLAPGEAVPIAQLTVANGSSWLLAMSDLAAGLHARICMCALVGNCAVVDTGLAGADPKPVPMCRKPNVPFGTKMERFVTSETLLSAPGERRRGEEDDKLAAPAPDTPSTRRPPEAAPAAPATTASPTTLTP